jgi:two-component system phosphate regulon sensor histidine kinase PhoR
MKNLTPRQLTFLITFLVTLGVFLFLFLYDWQVEPLAHLVFLLPLFVAVITYVSVYFLLQYFIYRKIKVIYKNISDYKLGKHKEEVKPLVDMSKDVIGEQVEAVEEWAKAKETEIEQLRELEQLRREFFGNVSHELKTPVFNIQGYLETLIDGGLNDEEINISYLKKAIDNVERLNNIVQDLIHISSIESGEIEMRFTVFNFKELVTEVYEYLSIRARKRQIRLDFKSSCSASYKVYADKEKIREALENLLNNAINYGKENGEVLVGCYDMEKNMLIEVSDNGIGIPKEHLPHVFDRFYRVDKARSRQSGGTGLGLSIVKHIIEAHKQTIHVRSTEGVGTTFGFTLQKAE